MEQFLEFIATVMKVDVSELNEETSFKVHPKWDSLMHMKLVMSVEDEYDTEIPLDQVPNIKTLKDLYQYTLD